MENFDLIAKYIAGEATSSETSEVERWLSENASNKILLEEMRQALRPMSSKEDDTFSKTLETDWSRIRGRTSISNPRKDISFFANRSLVYKVAAAILVILSGFSFWLYQNLNADIKLQNISTSAKEFHLPDSTKIWLHPGSSIRFANNFNSTDRRVKLEGEGYFEVAKDVTRPFFIISGPIETKVVGTKFNIRDDHSGKTTVTVTEGRVIMMNTDNEKSVFLQANDVGAFDYATNQLVKSANNDMNFLSWKTGKLQFVATHLNDVCRDLSRFYGKQIAVKDPVLKDVQITTVLDNISVDEALLIISTTLNLRVEVRDSKILFVQ